MSSFNNILDKLFSGKKSLPLSFLSIIFGLFLIFFVSTAIKVKKEDLKPYVFSLADISFNKTSKRAELVFFDKKKNKYSFNSSHWNHLVKSEKDILEFFDKGKDLTIIVRDDSSEIFGLTNNRITITPDNAIESVNQNGDMCMYVGSGMFVIGLLGLYHYKYC